MSRDNFGPNVAQVAGAVAADQLHASRWRCRWPRARTPSSSAVPALGRARRCRSPIAFVVLIAFGNLRGIREAGSVFAIPTYFFIANMAVLIVAGLGESRLGDLLRTSPRSRGTVTFGHAGGGPPARRLAVLSCCGPSPTAGRRMTGTEAISNGVSIFREPQASNARTTLVIMSTILGAMFLGVSRPGRPRSSRPFVSGTPTVVSADRQARLRARRARAQSSTCCSRPPRSHPDPGRQHQLHRVPVPGQLRRRGLLPAPPAHGPGSPARVLQRIIVLAVGVDRVVVATRAKVDIAHPHVRHRGVHRVHHGRAGMAKYHLTHRDAAWRRRRRRQRHGRRGLPASW